MTKQEKSWILYDWANSAFTLIIVTTIFPIFFKDYIAGSLKTFESTAYLGYANSAYALIVAIMAPILGTMADFKGMKKKLFTGFFLLGVISTLLLSFSAEGYWKICLLIYILGAVGFAASNIFYNAFLVDVTTDERMDWISASGFGWGYIGSVIPFIISMGLISFHGFLGIKQVTATRLSFLLTGFWWFVFTIPFLKNVEQTYYKKSTKYFIKKSFKRLKNFLVRIKDYKKIVYFLIAYFFYIDGVYTIIKMAVPYAKDIGMKNEMLLLLLLFIQVVAFPFALLFGKLAKRYTPKIMIITGIMIYFVITFFAAFISKPFHFWILGFMVALAQGGIQSLSRSLYSKIIPKDSSAEFFGFYNILGKFAAILGPFMVGLFSHLFSSSRYGILSLSILFLVGLIFISKVDTASSQNEDSA
ncbi:MAG: MFS transporter [Candidatus Mcinerneyibacterium aminivorans]|uniref:MFS transporter n=1 Tax=Candidatus Mcinerneyibacterium aminivorans TaxID=2703815 RepID=A0A5D0MKU4_9BACT|nr:MAG: MFS transporter [Candidatus Mcinerneyibacterium aminivorans]